MGNFVRIGNHLINLDDIVAVSKETGNRNDQIYVVRLRGTESLSLDSEDGEPLWQYFESMAMTIEELNG